MRVLEVYWSRALSVVCEVALRQNNVDPLYLGYNSGKGPITGVHQHGSCVASTRNRGSLACFSFVFFVCFPHLLRARRWPCVKNQLVPVIDDEVIVGTCCTPRPAPWQMPVALAHSLEHVDTSLSFLQLLEHSCFGRTLDSAYTQSLSGNLCSELESCQRRGVRLCSRDMLEPWVTFGRCRAARVHGEVSNYVQTWIDRSCPGASGVNHSAWVWTSTRMLPLEMEQIRSIHVQYINALFDDFEASSPTQDN